MRRRPPRSIELAPDDAAHLLRLTRNGRTEQRVARRARILLAMANPSTVVQDLAAKVGQRRETIWQLCRRYESNGVRAVEDAPRVGRPRKFLPPAVLPRDCPGITASIEAPGDEQILQSAPKDDPG